MLDSSKNKPSAIVIGGGIAGMTAAHELIERNFQVTVFEKKLIPGGKARSMPVPNSAVGVRRELPGEHGFRFFPGFYRHTFDTMKRIPLTGGKSVFHNLVCTRPWLVATKEQGCVLVPTRFPRSLVDTIRGLKTTVKILQQGILGIPANELLYFLRMCFVLLTSCEKRRFEDYEKQTWFSFFEEDKLSAAFKKYILSVLPLIFVACRADRMSVRTGGYIFIQLCLSTFLQTNDRILNAPTNEAWINPWLTDLQNKGVNYQSGAVVTKISCDDHLIQNIRVIQDGVEREYKADFYILAVPLDVMQSCLTSELLDADPGLQGIQNLHTEWMVGLQFYLDRVILEDVGHALFLDTPWSITTISQTLYWETIDLSEYGDGRIKSILSVIISDWHTPGVLYNKPAKLCDREELISEIWVQLESHLSGQTLESFKQAKIERVFVDPALTDASATDFQYSLLEPLFINTVDSWKNRPGSISTIKNLFLAADYVKTNTDLATMESANEAARRAVNSILDAVDSKEEKCKIWAFGEPWFFEPFRYLDRIRFEKGLPNIFSK